MRRGPTALLAEKGRGQTRAPPAIGLLAPSPLAGEGRGEGCSGQGCSNGPGCSHAVILACSFLSFPTFLPLSFPTFLTLSFPTFLPLSFPTFLPLSFPTLFIGNPMPG